MLFRFAVVTTQLTAISTLFAASSGRTDFNFFNTDSPLIPLLFLLIGSGPIHADDKTIDKGEARHKVFGAGSVVHQPNKGAPARLDFR